MDIATILGLIVAWGAVFGSLLLEGGELHGLINISAFVLVIGGTMGVTIIGLPFKQLTQLPKILMRAFFSKPIDQISMMTAMTSYAVRARRDGVLTLEEEAKQVKDPFIKLGLELVIDGTPGEMTQEILETELEAMQTRHRAGEGIFSAMGGFCPTLGILGTVMGLVHMLANLSEPDKMGGAIANAFIATLYGVGFANLLFLPIGNKLKARSAHEVAAYQLAIEGILAIQAGESPREVAARMRSFLSPREKAVYDQGKAGVSGAA